VKTPQQFDPMLLAHEALLNAWLYGEGSEIRYRISAIPSGIVQTYIYETEPFNPTPPEFSVRETGWGLVLIHRLCSQPPEYRFVGGGVIVRLVMEWPV
jgi:hypothetical protein